MTAAAHDHDYPALHRYGLWLFIASEAFLFGILLTIRFIVAGTEVPEAVNLPLGLLLTAILLSTSWFAHQAEKKLEAGSAKGAANQLWIAVILGLIFLVIVGFEWATGFEEFPASTTYGSAFYLITGTHGLHLFTGMLALASLAIQAQRGALGSGNEWKLGAGVRYWHFVDVVWISVFLTLYII